MAFENFHSLPCTAGQDGRLFLTTNEENPPTTLRKIGRRAVEQNTTLAVSGFFGLNLISAHTTPQLILLDRSRYVTTFWKEMIPRIRKARDCAEALQATIELIQEKTDLVHGKVEEELNRLQDEVDEGFSWLSSEKRFRPVKKLFDEGRFAFVEMDLTVTSHVNWLKQKLDAENLSLETLYLSNIGEYAENEGRGSEYEQMVGALANERTYVIETADRPNGESPMVQVISREGDPSFPKKHRERRIHLS